VKQIHQFLKHAERAVTADDLVPAFLLAWAGLEAAMRYRTRQAGIASDRLAGAIVLLRSLFAAGFLDSEELRDLDQANKTRTQIVHGLAMPKIGRTDVDHVIALAKRMLNDNYNPESP
jgi:hypothetical protein